MTVSCHCCCFAAGSSGCAEGKPVAHAVPDNDSNRSHSKERSRSCSRSRHRTPEPTPRSPAVPSPGRHLSQTPLQRAASKSPRAVSRSRTAAWRSPGAAEIRTAHTDNRSPRAVGRSAVASGTTARDADGHKTHPAEDKDQKPGRSASLSRLQRPHRSASTTAHKACTHSPLESSHSPFTQAGQAQAEDQDNQPAREGLGGTGASAIAPQFGDRIRRSRSGSAGVELLSSTPCQYDLTVEGCSRQRPASSPPMAMLSEAPRTVGGQEMHGSSDALFTARQCNQRQLPVHQQQQQTVLRMQPRQEKQQQEWLVQQQEEPQQQQQQQQLPHAGFDVHHQPAAISLGSHPQGGAAWASLPGITPAYLGSPPPGSLHPMLLQQQLQHRQPQQAGLAPVSLQSQVGLPSQLDHMHSAAAAALHATSSACTDGKQAAAQAECKGRHIMPQASAANACSLWGHPKQLSSHTGQQEVPLQRTTYQPTPWSQQQATTLAPVLECAHELQVQKLSVTPHKPPRQLSGNPFAELPEGHALTENATTQAQHVQLAQRAQQAQHAQHVPTTGHAAALCVHAEPLPTVSGSAKPLIRLQKPSGLALAQQPGANCNSAGLGQAAACNPEAGNAQQSSEAPEYCEGSAPSAAVPRSSVQSTVAVSQASICADQTSRCLLNDLEIEAVAADAEACLLELQVCSLFACCAHL